MIGHWKAKQKITGGAGDIPKGTPLILVSANIRRLIFVRADILSDGAGVQNRIIMHQPSWWDEFLEYSTT